MKNDKKYFRVKYGYDVSDQVSIEEKDLEKAIYAQVTGKPIQLGNSYIKGANIISITPHYHKHTGWYDWYEPQTGDDFAQIQRDCPNYDGVIGHYKERVKILMQQGREKLIGQNVDLKLLK